MMTVDVEGPMLARLSIRDIVLIDRLDIDFASGLSVLTGETGAGKSILLDAFALALGARGDATLVRQGAEQGQVTAMFELPAKHPARALLTESDIATDEALILRRDRPCGLFFQVEGPRLLRNYAVWAGEEHRILFYNSCGERVAETRLAEAPDPRSLAA